MSFLKDGPVRLIARLVRSEAVINNDLVLHNANRVSFEFDCIDARLATEEALATIEDRGDRSRLVVLKILTTAENFRYLAEVPEYGDGQWYRINLLPRGKQPGPFAWASTLSEGGYNEVIPSVLEEICFLFSESELPLGSVGAAVADDRAHAQKIAEAGKFPQHATRKGPAARELLRHLGKPSRIVVRDVGQASFCSALDHQGNELFHLDAGWPISYNNKTASHKPQLKVADAPVILSHWDWDHLHGYHAIPGLAGSTWIAPVQRLGPGAALVAKKLAENDRLLGVKWANQSAGSLRLGCCKGKAGNLNLTGLWIRTTLRCGKTVLFVGDAGYDLIPLQMKALPDLVVATHHGANFAGNVVTPNGGRGHCVVSVGKGNGYGHPSDDAVARHAKAGWLNSFTCSWNGVSRGSRYLGP